MTRRNTRIGAIAVIATLLLVVLALGWWFRPVTLHGTELQSSSPMADFELVGSDGTPVRLSDFRGKWTVIYFGYTFCPDVCPTTLGDLSQMMQALDDKRDNVQVVMVTVDPERDTPERLGQYLTYFDPSFIGLTGEAEQIEAAASQFGVFYEKEPGSVQDYLISHTSTVAVIDPEGTMRIVYPYGVSGNDMAADLRYFIRRQLF
jgi:protein SCO1/2